MAETIEQVYTITEPKDIYDVIQKAYELSDYESIHSICTKNDLKPPLIYRLRGNLRKAKPNEDKKYGTLHTLQGLCQPLGLEFWVSVSEDTDLTNGLQKEWKLDFNRIIDLNMLRKIQNDWFESDGQPCKDATNKTYKVPEDTLLFDNYYYSSVFVSAEKWNEAIQNHQEPGKDTTNYYIGYLLKLLSALDLKLTIRMHIVKKEPKPLQTETCNPKPDEQVLIGRYRSLRQHDLARFKPYIYYVRKGKDSHGHPYTSDVVLNTIPDYILMVPSRHLLSDAEQRPNVIYDIFKHDGKIKTIDRDQIKEYGYVTRTPAKAFQSYGLECVVGNISINVKNLLKYIGQNEDPLIRSLSFLVENNILEVREQKEVLGMVAQEEDPE